jgi:hypothetical protein
MKYFQKKVISTNYLCEQASKSKKSLLKNLGKKNQ